MSNIYHLRPPGQKAPQPALAADAAHLRVALSAVQLAAIICRSSAPRVGFLPEEVVALAQKFAANDRDIGPNSKQQKLGAELYPVSVNQGRVASIPSVPIAVAPQGAFVAAEVLAGRVRFDQEIFSGSDFGRSHLGLRAKFIGAPDDVLVARQERTRTTAFSITSLQELGDLTSSLISVQKHMVESWARQGGRPSIRFRYQGPRPFGRVAHVGAIEATDLRAIGVQLSIEPHSSGPTYLADLSLAQR